MIFFPFRFSVPPISRSWKKALISSVILTPGILLAVLSDPGLPPANRVQDNDNLIPAGARANLESVLDELATRAGINFYIVASMDVPSDELSIRSDETQAKWVPSGQGGTFLYSMAARQYAFSPAPGTLDLVGRDLLLETFTGAMNNLPLKDAMEVMIAVPMQRVAGVIIKKMQDEAGARVREREAKLTLEKQQAQDAVLRWVVIGAVVLGVLAYFFWPWKGPKNRINIPPPGMAYTGKPRQRQRRRDRHKTSEEY